MSETRMKTTANSQDAAKTEDKRRCPEPGQSELGRQAEDDLFLGAFLGSSVTNPRLDQHATLLSHPHFSCPVNGQQKAQIVGGLQRRYGNAYVQRLIESRVKEARLPVNPPDGQCEREVDVGGTTVTSRAGVQPESNPKDDRAPIQLERQADGEEEKTFHTKHAHADTDRKTRDREGAEGIQAKAVAPSLSEVVLGQPGEMPPEEKLPPFEVITATTSAQGGYDDFSRGMAHLWKQEKLDFVAAARRTAAKLKVPHGKYRHRGEQSLEVSAPRPYKRRWCLSLHAWDYEGRESDLREYRHFMRRGSPFRQSMLKSFDKVIDIENPTGQGIRSAIVGAQLDLWSSLAGNESGELVVYWDGHGAAGGIEGVDGGVVTKHELRNIAVIAGEEWLVHFIYILNCCLAGELADLARQEALRRVDERTAALPRFAKAKLREPREALEDLLNDKSVLGTRASEVSSFAMDWLRYREKRNDPNPGMRRTEMKRLKPLVIAGTGPDKGQLHHLLEILFFDLLAPPARLPLRVGQRIGGEIGAAQEALNTVHLWKRPIAPNMHRMMRAVADVLDSTGDLINDLSKTLLEQAATRAKEGSKPAPKK